jgi:CRISPR system Cascade subunit CasD
MFETTLTAESALAALVLVGGNQGAVYSEENSTGAIELKKRDVPIIHQPRQFASRTVFLTTNTGVPHVPK